MFVCAFCSESREFYSKKYKWLVEAFDVHLWNEYQYFLLEPSLQIYFTAIVKK